jgi:ferredoxin
MERRSFIKSLFGFGFFLAGVLAFCPPPTSIFSPRKAEKVPRPPNAQREGIFQTLCARCGVCYEVCPTKAIEICNKGEFANIGTPILTCTSGACIRCLNCIKSCPTEALGKGNLNNAKYPWEFPQTVNAIAKASRPGRCSGCKLCESVCPRNYRGRKTISIERKSTGFSINILTLSKENIDKGLGCIGCGSCVFICNKKAGKVLKMEGIYYG